MKPNLNWISREAIVNPHKITVMRPNAPKFDMTVHEMKPAIPAECLRIGFLLKNLIPSRQIPINSM